LRIIADTDDIAQEFEKYWTIEQDKAFLQLVDEEKLSKTRTQALIERFYIPTNSQCVTRSSNYSKAKSRPFCYARKQEIKY
jgi:hypothetical protein